MGGTLKILWDMYSEDRTTEPDYSLGDFNTTFSEMQVARKLARTCGSIKYLKNVGRILLKKISQTYDSLTIIDCSTKNKLITNSTNQKP